MRSRYNDYRKKYNQGGSINKSKVDFISDESGLHQENSYGGVPLTKGKGTYSQGGQSLVEKGEGVIRDEQGNPTFILPHLGDGDPVPMLKPNTSHTDFELDKYGNYILSNETIADWNKKERNRGSEFRDSENNSFAQERFKRNDELSMIATEENKKLNAQKDMMSQGALQYAANGGKLTRDIEKIVMEEYSAAYGGKLPNKFKGKVNMPNSYDKGGRVREFAKKILASKGGYVYNAMTQPMLAQGGPMVSNIQQPFNGPAAQNRGGMMMANGGMMQQQMMQQQGGQDQVMQLVQAYAQATGISPEELIQQLQQMEPQAQQQAIQQMAQELQGGQQQGMQQQMPAQEMAHGGYIQYARGGDIGGPVTLTPTQEYFANEMYKRYGKVVLTDKATNETIYGTKKKDGTWDLNKFEVLTGANSTGQDIALPLKEIEKLKGSKQHAQKKTPLGVFGLNKHDNIYGMPGYFLGNTSAAYHVTYKGADDPNRAALFNNKNNEDNYRSYGCINCEKPSMQNLIKFVGDSGFATVIDSRISPEENSKYILKNTPSTAFKSEKPVSKTAARVSKPAPSPSYDTRFSAVPSNLQSGTKKPAAPRPKTEQIKKQIQKQAAVKQPPQSTSYMRAATPSQMPAPRKSVQQTAQQPVMQAPASDYRGTSIVDYLASTGQDFSKENRASLAKQYGIENYNYTAEDNLNLLNRLRSQETPQYAMNGGRVYAAGGPPYNIPGMADMSPLEYNFIDNISIPNYVDNQGNMSSILGRVNNVRSNINNTRPLEGGPGKRIIGYDEYGQPIYANPLSNPNQPATPEVNYGNDYFLNRQPGLPMEGYSPNNQTPVATPNQVQPTDMFNVRDFTNLPDEGVNSAVLSNRPVDPMQTMNLQQPLATNNVAPDLAGNVQSLSDNDFYGLDADGNPVSINPDMYYKYQTGQFTPEGATLSPDRGFFNKAIDRLGNESTTDALVAAGQLAAPLFQFFQKKPEPFQYKKASANLTDPTAAIEISNAQQREAEKLAGYNIKQNAPTSGSYLSNMRALGLGAGKQRGATAAGIRQQYDVNNAGILNQFEQYNTELENRAIDAMQQDQANFQEQRTNALYNAAANVAGVYKDKKTRDMYKNYIVPNIGSNNYELVQDANGNYSFKPRDGSASSFQVTKPETGTKTTTPANEIVLNENKTSQVPAKYSLNQSYFDTDPKTLNPEEVKSFQEWMNVNHPNWAKGKNVGKKSKGYGRFGESTKAAYDKYINYYYPNTNEFPI
jgi:hypothetical protein